MTSNEDNRETQSYTLRNISEDMKEKFLEISSVLQFEEEHLVNPNRSNWSQHESHLARLREVAESELRDKPNPEITKDWPWEEVMKEPTVTHCTMRDSMDSDGIYTIDIECRFSDGQKFAAITVESDFPNLASLVCEFLNYMGRKPAEDPNPHNLKLTCADCKVEIFLFKDPVAKAAIRNRHVCLCPTCRQEATERGEP